MKKTTILMLLLAILSVGTAQAIPAHPGTYKTVQPDGTIVTLRLVGDEFLHFRTTADGYTVVKDQRGYYVYARLDSNGQLEPTDCIAHDEAERTPLERSFAQSIGRRLTPSMAPERAAEQQAEKARRADRLGQQRVQQYDYTKFRGLILLVEYNDCAFTRSDYSEVMDGMVNQENYRGTSVTNISRTQGVCTGSVRDFYTDSSNGLFKPEFDIVGPIKVDRSMYFYGGDRINDYMENAYYLIADAINAADASVDFSEYDRDGDGIVDMVYFIFAGLGSHFADNDERLLWPHASYIYNPYGSYYNRTLRKDGVELGRYACSTELYGTPEWSTLNGIGTICHEFGHVLGLPDFYDVDYEESGGESHHPGEWSVMAGGGYSNYSRTPAVYTLFERYALGWATPQTITAEGTYTLESLDKSNTGYRLDSQTKNEYFLFENRQQTKWNAYLPGHGMLVFRVDSTNTEVWRTNSVNNNPKHNYFEMIRAGGWPSNNEGVYQFATDPFPGTQNVTTLNNATTPGHLKSWAGKETLLGLENISESRQGVVTFDVVDVNVLRAISLPESLTIGKGTSRQLTATRTPDYAPYTLQWTSSNEAVATVSSTGMVSALSEGTATITVTGRSPKQSETEAVSASCVITVETFDVANNIQEFNAKAEGAEAALMLSNAQVLYKNGNTFYLRDATGALAVTVSGTSWKRNDVLNGSLFGTHSTTGGMPTFTANSKTDPSGVTASSSDTPATPVIKAVNEVTTADRADLLTLHSVKLQTVASSGVFAMRDGHQVRIYNTFTLRNLKNPTAFDGKRFDATGILVTRQLNGEIVDELALLSSITEAEPEYFNFAIMSFHGHVVVNGTEQSTNATLPIIKDEDVVLEMVPDEGYVFQMAMLNTKRLTPDEGFADRFTLHGLYTDQQLVAAFIKDNDSAIDPAVHDLSPETPVSIYTAGGTLVARTTLADAGQLRLPSGIYVIKAKGRTIKLVRP